MRYILDDSGYIYSVSCNPIECNNKGCTGYTGSVPEGYDSIELWATTANIRAYKIVNGNLTYDADRAAALEAEWSQCGINNVYSREEQIIGVWVDGKPIYRQVFEFGKVTYINTNISSIDNIIKMECLVHSTGNQWRTIPWLFKGAAAEWQGGFYFREDNKTINFQAGDSLWNIDKGIFIMEYTK